MALSECTRPRLIMSGWDSRPNMFATIGAIIASPGGVPTLALISLMRESSSLTLFLKYRQSRAGGLAMAVRLAMGNPGVFKLMGSYSKVNRR